jgi:hypothetical protein
VCSTASLELRVVLASTARAGLASTARQARSATKSGGATRARHRALQVLCITASPTPRDAIAQRLPPHLIVFAARVAGYFCPNGTSVVSPSISCFSATTHCPSGSWDRQSTPSGHYAVAVAGSNPPVFGSERECQPGTYCEAGVRLSCSGV